MTTTTPESILAGLMHGAPFRSPLTPLSADQLALRRQVYKEISTNGGTFSMRAWESTRPCGTVRCVAGWAAYYAGVTVPPEHESTRWEQLGIYLLGLTRLEWLGDDEGALFYATPRRAVERMRDLAQVDE